MDLRRKREALFESEKNNRAKRYFRETQSAFLRSLEGTGESRTLERPSLSDRGTGSPRKKRRRRKALLSYVVAQVFANYLERPVDSNWTLR